MTRLQTQHRRQSPIPDAFASATLSAAARDARTPAQRAQRARDARKVARLVSRGELEIALASSDDLETALSLAGRAL